MQKTSLSFIQTGGTIDKDYPKHIRGWAFEISTPAVSRALERLNPNFDFDIIPLLQKDSLEITEQDRQLLKDTIMAAPSDKFIITHGTDTMDETGQFLVGIEGKTIVLTGAMRPERFSNSDADINLGMAIGVASVAAPGVFIVMHGQVLSPGKIGRDEATGQFVRLA